MSQKQREWVRLCLSHSSKARYVTSESDSRKQRWKRPYDPNKFSSGVLKAKQGLGILAQVEVNGTPIDAQMATGSPEPLSMDFIMKVVGNEKPHHQNLLAE